MAFEIWKPKLKILLSHYVSLVSKGIDRTAIRSDAWHHRSNAIVSGFALSGISIAVWAKNPAADN
jgi:divalent metal cation (Fe/Co/Zn/Cd) transporter